MNIMMSPIWMLLPGTESVAIWVAWCQFVPSGSPCSSHRSGLHVLLAEMLSFINTILTFWKQISKNRFITGIMQYCGWAVGRRWPSNASKQFNFCVNFLSLTDNLTALTQIKNTPSPLCLEKLWHCTRMWDPRENYMHPKNESFQLTSSIITHNSAALRGLA